MTATRKTLPRTELVGQLNTALAADAGLTDAQRLTLASFVGNVLLATNSYRGFTYLPTELTEGPDGNTVLRPGYNDSRRRYF